MRTTRPARAPAAVAAGAAFLALAARLVYLLRKPFWFDELFTLWISRQSPGLIAHALRLDSGPPLFYLLEAPFLRVADLVSLDAVARAMPLLAMAALFLAGTRRETSGGARFTVLLATSPLLFFYSGEARAYALLAALGFLLFLADFRIRSRRSRLVAAVLAAGLLPWTHYLGVFVVAGSILLCLLRKRRRLALAQIAAVLPFAAWIPMALRQPAAAISWSEEGWLRSLSGALGAFGFWPRIPAYFSRFDPPQAWAGAVLGAAVIAAATVAARRRPAIRDALLFAGIPILLSAAAAVIRPVYFAGRTEMMTLPVALWAFARAARKSVAARWLTTASAAAGAVLIAGAVLMPPGQPPYAMTAAMVSGSARAGDLVVASDADYLPLRLAADRGALRAEFIGIPAGVEEHPGWFEPGKLVSPTSETSRLGQALSRVKVGQRVFFAVPPDPAPRSIVMPFVRGGPVRIVRPPGGDSVLILQK